MTRRVTAHLRTQTMIPDPRGPLEKRTSSLARISQMLMFNGCARWEWVSCSQLSLFLSISWLSWPSWARGFTFCSELFVMRCRR
ncbi:hypothetical protein DL95DRAFT_144500 [Leptodontidium sp. 2 PMI_412]|nr:hypothetical protein DL95DRAFT_144500 [Leptodontidium sp. 2 PMI_412]